MYLSKTKLLSFFRNIAWLTPKEKKVGVYPAEKREETLKKYFTITRYQTLLGSYIFLSQNGGNYFVISSALRRRINLKSFLLEHQRFPVHDFSSLFHG